uniref:F-box domain-containing protein n=1 Tax=Caenorhabditis tropicalis TaxID=1561998 RepID=A0A1I7UT77_9PELO
MSFSLLRLPDLALEEILKNFRHKEILFLAQTSQRARRRISRLIKSQAFQIRAVDDSFSLFVQIFYEDREIFRIFTGAQEEQINWRFKTLFTDWYQENTWVCHWRRDFQELMNFLNELFRIKQVSFQICKEPSSSVLLFLDHITAMNLKIGKVEWSAFKRNQEMTEKFLMAFRGASYLEIKGFNSPSIRFNHFHLFRMDQLLIRDARWMTVENIIDLRNCKRVNLDFVELDTANMNQILWKLTKNPGEIQELRMTGDIKLRGLVKGLNNVRVEKGGRALIYWFTTDNGVQFSVTEDFITVVIKRDT